MTQPALTNERAIASGLVELLESGLPTQKELERALLTIPPRCWDVQIESDGARAARLATARVNAPVTVTVTLREAVHFDDAQSELPNSESVLGFWYPSDLNAMSGKDVGEQSAIYANSPKLVAATLKEVLSRLGELDTFEARFAREQERAKQYAVDREWAIEALASVPSSAPHACIEQDVSRAFFRFWCEERSSGGDALEVLGEPQALRIRGIDGPTIDLYSAHLVQIDEHGNEYPFHQLVAQVGSPLGRFIRLEATSDLGGAMYDYISHCWARFQNAK